MPDEVVQALLETFEGELSLAHAEFSELSDEPNIADLRLDLDDIVLGLLLLEFAFKHFE